MACFNQSRWKYYEEDGQIYARYTVYSGFMSSYVIYRVPGYRSFDALNLSTNPTLI